MISEYGTPIMKDREKSAVGFRHRECGAALIVSLVFLVVLTLTGVASTQVNILEERMAGNMRDRSLAFQAAETALRVAENRLSPAASLPVFDDTSGFYVCTDAHPSWWDALTDSDWASSSDKVQHYSGTSLADVASSPGYVVEQLKHESTGAASGGSKQAGVPTAAGSAQKWYRITARGTGGSASSTVILQSIYRR
jgi:type IV pilus assembly protein PilX